MSQEPKQNEKAFEDMTEEEKEAQWEKTLNSQGSSDLIDFLIMGAQDEIARGDFTED